MVSIGDNRVRTDMDPRVEGFTYDVVLVGGAGHVGLPLAIAFASRGLKTCIYDINEEAVATLLGGDLPFREVGAQEVLRQVLDDTNLSVSTDEQVIGSAEHVVVVIGTPVDDHLKP
jgi:UDP-N-acetyl-D-mannosaminuronic acid dehydrogenase